MSKKQRTKKTKSNPLRGGRDWGSGRKKYTIWTLSKGFFTNPAHRGPGTDMMLGVEV